MIGYDLDGVLIPDMNFGEYQIEDFLRIRRDLPRAMFQPEGEYVIITGRPASDAHHTVDWVQRSLDIKPQFIYHGNVDWTTAKEYKADTIQKLGLKMFVESCPEQAEFFRRFCPNTEIVCFPEFVLSKIQNHFEGVR